MEYNSKSLVCCLKSEVQPNKTITCALGQSRLNSGYRGSSVCETIVIRYLWDDIISAET